MSLSHKELVSFASLSTECVTFPIDTLRAKTQGGETFVRTGYSHIFKQLYSGISIAIIRQVTNTTLKLQLFDALHATNIKNEFVCGWISGAIATVLVNPIDILKNHRQTATSYPNKKLHAIYKEIVHANGLRGFTHGITLNVLRGSIISSCEYGTYFTLRDQNIFSEQLNPLLCGSLAGFTTAIVVHPIDRIRNKVQYATNRPNGSVPTHPWPLNEYFRGFKYALFRRVLFNAMFFSIVDSCYTLTQIE